MKKTPLFENHQKLNARMVPFAGYEMPVQYKGVLDETKAVRSSAGLFDVSHMGQFVIKGAGGLEALNNLVTNDLMKLKLGQAQYNIMCEPSGGTIDDLVIYRRQDNEVNICVNASNREKDFAWMKEHLDSKFALDDESDHTALIALQGPNTNAILEKTDCKSALESLKFYWATDATLFGKSVYLSRTGYTGEAGYEIYCQNDYASEIWEGLLEAGSDQGIMAAGLGSRDTLRTEMGYPLYGHELTEKISPIAAGLKWVVKLTKDNFVGKEALAKEHEQGPAQALKALVINDKRMARPGYRVLDGEKPIGFVSSGVFSPHLNKPIALAFLDKDFDSSQKCRIEIRKGAAEAEVVSLPFVQSRTK